MNFPVTPDANILTNTRFPGLPGFPGRKTRGLVKIMMRSRKKRMLPRWGSRVRVLVLERRENREHREMRQKALQKQRSPISRSK